jgi:hypothetical protein
MVCPDAFEVAAVASVTEVLFRYVIVVIKFPPLVPQPTQMSVFPVSAEVKFADALVRVVPPFVTASETVFPFPIAPKSLTLRVSLSFEVRARDTELDAGAR